MTEPQGPPANNLPFQMTSFIGREQELAEIKRLLGLTSQPGSSKIGSRVLTLIGAGGTGKTRLSVQIATEVLEYYPEGVWQVELAPLSDPALITQLIATTLNLTEQPGKPLAATLLEYLKPRRLLLLLDNCEHLIEECARLADQVLRSCPQVQILATSRESLGISGEITFRVPSLSAPNPKRMPPVDKLGEYEAVKLFMDRALAANPNFNFTSQNAPALVQLCYQLDGIPLALELAAARIKMMTLEQIASRLNDRFKLLTGGVRTALPRQQTLRALISWSYDLLSEGEQVLWRRLAVFAGGWSMEAAEQVCAGGSLEDFEILDYLTQLVNKSLVVFEEEAGGRYRFLESIRQYGREKLQEAGEIAEFQARHLTYFAAMGEQAVPHLMGGHEQVNWLKRLETEHDNLRTALEWAGQSGPQNIEIGLKLGTALWKFWETRGYLTEGRERLDKLLAQAREAELAGSSAFAWALNRASLLAWRQGDLAAAQPLGEEALGRMRTLDDRVGTGATLTNLANLLLDQGKTAEARHYLEESLEMLRQAGDRQRVAIALANLGVLDLNQGDFAAYKLLEESLEIFRELKNQTFTALVQSNLGVAAMLKGELQLARTQLLESLAISEELGNTHITGTTLNNLGLCEQQLGDFSKALTHHRKSLQIFGELGNQQEIAHCLVGFAGLALRQRQPDQAARLLGAVEAVLNNSGGTLIGYEKVEYEQALSGSRQSLSSGSFDTALVAGRGLSIEQASAEALRWTLPGAEDATTPVPLTAVTTPVYQGVSPVPAQSENKKGSERLLPAVRLALAPGMLLGGTYLLENQLGSGAMGEVWLARHKLLNEPRAIKIILGNLSENTRVQERFIQSEARHSLRLEQHPHIVRVYELGLHQEMPYIVMEYLTPGPSGATLRDLIKARGKFSLKEVGQMLDQLASALDLAHRYGLIHRDVKPANILVDGRQPGLWLKLSDFGLVKDTGIETELTGSGHALGTPLYMAPEQARGEPEARSDIYSMGVIIYQLLAGQPPFQGDFVSLLIQHSNTLPPPLHQIEPSLPVEVAEVVLKALAKEPGDRYAQAGEMAHAYRQALQEWETRQSEHTQVLADQGETQAISHDPISGSGAIKTSSQSQAKE